MLDDLKGELAAEEVDSTVPGTMHKPLLTNRRQLSAGERQELLAMVQGTRSRAEAASGVAGHAPSMHGSSFVGSSSRPGSVDDDESLREARISMYLPRLLNRLLATDGVGGCGLSLLSGWEGPSAVFGLLQVRGDA
jgi:hypothetical protein